MTRLRPIWLTGVVLAGLVGIAHAAQFPSNGCVLRIELAAGGKPATVASGTLTVTPGQVVELKAVQPARMQISKNSWSINPQQLKRNATIVLEATLECPETADLTLALGQSEIRCKLDQLEIGRREPLGNGTARITRLPLSLPIAATADEEDLPAAAVGPDGRVWVAYLCYKHAGPLDAARIHKEKDFSQLVPTNNGDQILLLCFDGKSWSGPWEVTAKGGDVWRPTVTVDGQGAIWIVWSQNVDENWDLFARRFDPVKKAFSDPLRLTKASGADVDPVAVTCPVSGTVHVVWQGWRNQSFDILRCAISPDGVVSAEKVVYGSDANEWWPAAVCDSKGNLAVAFDTYEAGNYDVKLVCRAQTDSPTVVDVASGSYFEARPAVAVDGQDRIWIAFEQAGANWGKDVGMRWLGPRGELLYWRRNVIVRVWNGAQVREVPAPVPLPLMSRNYPIAKTQRASHPRLAIGKNGTVWLLFRRHPNTAGGGERWCSFATQLLGDRWSLPIEIPNSANLMDNRPAVITRDDGQLLIVHSTDHRTGGTTTAKQNDLFCTVLPAQDVAGEFKLAAPTPDPDVPPVHPKEAEEIARIRSYRAVVGGKTYRLLRGEFHRHTELTSHRDQDGSLQDMWRYGMDAAGMDWIGNGDHDNGYGVEYLWWLVQKQTSIYHHPPYFMPMYTYERSVSYPSGHRNAMFSRRGIRPLPRIPGGNEMLYGTPEEGSPDIKTFYAYLRHFGGICASHTSATNMGTDWRDNDPLVEPVVEIYQGLRHSYEHYGAPATAKGPEDAIGGFRPAGFVWNALMKGYRLGFESSSDHYSTHISYTMVWAEEASREGILEAIRQRHCYAANDNIILDVRCGDHIMGDAFTLSEKPTLEIRAIGTGPIVRLSIIRGTNGDEPRYVYDSEPNTQEIRLRWTDQDPVWGNTSYYYVRIEQQRPKGGYGALVWASPMWITLERK